jgi:hypothetical protein
MADILTRYVLGQPLPAMGRAPFPARVFGRRLGHRRWHGEVLVLGKEGLLAWVEPFAASAIETTQQPLQLLTQAGSLLLLVTQRLRQLDDQSLESRRIVGQLLQVESSRQWLAQRVCHSSY